MIKRFSIATAVLCFVITGATAQTSVIRQTFACVDAADSTATSDLVISVVLGKNGHILSSKFQDDANSEKAAQFMAAVKKAGLEKSQVARVSGNCGIRDAAGTHVLKPVSIASFPEDDGWHCLVKDKLPDGTLMWGGARFCGLRDAN